MSEDENEEKTMLDGSYFTLMILFKTFFFVSTDVVFKGLPKCCIKGKVFCNSKLETSYYLHHLSDLHVLC